MAMVINVNIRVHISSQISVLIVFREIPRRGTAGSFGSSSLNYLKTLHTVSHNALFMLSQSEDPCMDNACGNAGH